MDINLVDAVVLRNEMDNLYNDDTMEWGYAEDTQAYTARPTQNAEIGLSQISILMLFIWMIICAVGLGVIIYFDNIIPVTFRCKTLYIFWIIIFIDYFKYFI